MKLESFFVTFLGIGFVSCYDSPCCNYNGLRCCSNKRCEVANDEILEGNGGTDVCAPSCGWIKYLACAANIWICSFYCHRHPDSVSCKICMGDCLDCIGQTDQPKLLAELGDENLANHDSVCCRSGNLRCYSNGRCENPSHETMKANDCTDICAPRSCGWIPALKCSVKIALCAAVCVETAGAGCIACLGSQYVDCIDCFRIDNKLKAISVFEEAPLASLQPLCCKYNGLQCYTNGRCEYERSKEAMNPNGCTDVCVPRSCSFLKKLACAPRIVTCTFACYKPIDTNGACEDCLGWCYPCLWDNSLTLLENQPKITAQVENKNAANLDKACCKFNDLQCFADGRCEKLNEGAMLEAETCADICVPRSCGWITRLKCSAKIALCAVSCIETIGGACIACLGSQYVDCVECFTIVQNVNQLDHYTTSQRQNLE